MGGAVRDGLLGIGNLDWDLATAATPPQVQRLFRRTVPKGIEFGTLGVFDRAGVMHEVTTFRRDVATDGRHAVVEFGASLDDDLARRDFTINAIAFDPISNELRDPFDGRRDLVAGVIRAVGVADDRFREDRLRALRAIRFASRFHFEFDPETWKAIVGSAPFMGRLSPERVREEMEKTMDQVADPSSAFSKWRESGAFESLIPALAQISDTTLGVCDCLAQPTSSARPARRLLRLAALFTNVSPGETEKTLRALRFSNRDVAWISSLVDKWQTRGPSLTQLLASHKTPPRGELRRLAAAIGRTRVGSFMRLAAAHWSAPENAGDAATRPLESALFAPPSAQMIRSLHREFLNIAFNDAIQLDDLHVDGDDMRMHGIPSGRLMGRILAVLLEEVIDAPSLNQRDKLLARAAELQSQFEKL